MGLVRLFAIFIVLAMPGMAIAKRDLPVPPLAGWKHAATGLILTAKLGGLARTEIYDLGDQELDMVVQYATADTGTQATVYLFKPALASVPVWFDRSETQIRLRSVYQGVTSHQTTPLAFPKPGASTSDSLRQSFTTGAREFKSTALAVMPVGDWLVVVRLSSNALGEEQLDSKLGEIINAIRFPTGLSAAEVAIPVQLCTTSQKRVRARLIKPDMGQTLLGAIAPQVEAKASADARSQGKPVPPAKRLCRDGQGTSTFGVYRSDDTEKSYILAIGDAGRVATVSAGIALLLPNPGFQVILRDLDSSAVYPSFDKLPLPEQVLELIDNQNPLSRTTGSNVSISTPAR